MGRVPSEGVGSTFRKIRGAAVAFEPFRRAHVVSLQVWVRAGASYETEPERGAAHFLEHMLFQSRGERFGGRSVGALAEEGGGSINAWTSQDYTVVHVTFPAPSFVDVTSAVLHTVLSTELSADVAQRERSVILQEIAREEENPGLHCMRTLFAERFHGHPYGRRVLGTAGSVAAMPVETLRNFHRRFYVPSNLVVAISGDVEAREVFTLLDRELAAHGRSGEAAPVVPNAGAGRTGLTTVQKDVAEAHFGIGYAIPPLRHPDVPALDLVSAVLGETRSSVLESWRQDEGLVNEISTASYTPIHGGTFLIQGATHPDRLGESMRRLREVVSQFVADGPAQAAVAAVQEEARAGAMRADETAHGRAGRLGYEAAALGRLGFFRRYLAQTLALDAARVGVVARRYLARGEASQVVVAPASTSLPVPPVFRIRAPRLAVPSDAPTRTVLPAGTVVLHWRDRTHPTVALRLQAPGGLEFETPANNGLHTLLTRLYACGAGGRGGPSVMRDLDALGAQFSPSSGQSSVSILLDVPVGRLFPALSLVADCLARPNLGASDIERERALLIEDVRTRIDRPASLLHRELCARLFAGHPYGLDPSGTREALERMGRDDLAARAAEVLDPSCMKLAIVGDCDAAEVAQALLAALGVGGEAPKVTPQPDDSPPLSPDLRPQASDLRPSLPVRIPGPFKQAHVGLIWPGATWSSPDRLPLAVFGNALGMMSGPLFRRLRDQMAVAYSFGFGASSMRLGGFLKASAAVRAGTETASIDAIRAEVARVLEGGDGALELIRRGAGHLAGAQEMAFQKKAVVAHWMCTNDGTPLGYDSYLTVADRLRRMDPAEALEAARRALAVEPIVVVLEPQATSSV